jgi:ABC-type arginine transport system permease subunit
MWVEAGVGMSVANDLASRNPEAAKGGGAYTDLLCAVPCFLFILFSFFNIIHSLFLSKYINL